MGFTQKNAVRILYAICALLGLVAIVFTDAMFNTSRLFKALIVFIIAICVFILNYIILKSPALRVHTGLFDDEPLPAVPANADGEKNGADKLSEAEKAKDDGACVTDSCKCDSAEMTADGTEVSGDSSNG